MQRPLLLETQDLLRRPGTMRQVRRVVPAPAELGTSVLAIPVGTDLDLDLRLEAVLEGILVSGRVRGQAEGECVRCLDPVREDVDVELQELYYYPDRAEVAGDEVNAVTDELIDLEPAIRDAVIPALSFRPLCTPDCPGLCPQCGERMAPGHQHETIDPRWAKLDRILDDKEES